MIKKYIIPKQNDWNLSITLGKRYEVTKEGTNGRSSDNLTYYFIDDKGKEISMYHGFVELVEQDLPEEYIVDSTGVSSKDFQYLKQEWDKHYNHFISFSRNWKYLIFSNDKSSDLLLDERENSTSTIIPRYKNLPIFLYSTWKELYNKQNQTKMTTFKKGDKVKLKTNYKDIKVDLGIDHKFVQRAELNLGQVYTVHSVYGDSSLQIKEDIGHWNIAIELFELATETKKIIGYKPPKFLFGNEITKDHVYKALSSSNVTFYAATINGNVLTSKYNLPKEVVEEWEPVYEDESLEIKIKGATLVIKESGKIDFSFGKNVVDDTTILNLLEISDKMKNLGGIGSYNISIPTIHVGCLDGIDLTREDLLGIINQYNTKFKK